MQLKTKTKTKCMHIFYFLTRASKEPLSNWFLKSPIHGWLGEQPSFSKYYKAIKTFQATYSLTRLFILWEQFNSLIMDTPNLQVTPQVDTVELPGVNEEGFTLRSKWGRSVRAVKTKGGQQRRLFVLAPVSERFDWEGITPRVVT